MPYCTLTDIEKMIDEDDLISLAYDKDAADEDAEEVAAAIETVVSSAIADSDAMIDAYLASRYTVPIESPPAIIRKLSVDIAIYNLYSRRSRVSEAVEQRYKDAVSMLRDISTGKALVAGSASAPPERSSDVVIISGPPRIFSRLSMEGF